MISIITKIPYLEHTSSLFKNIKKRKLDDLTKLSTATLMYKNLISASLPFHNYIINDIENAYVCQLIA